MANFTALKTAINNAIKTNGNEEITGAILQAILDAMVETLGDSAITDLENTITAEVTNRENAVGGVADDLAAEVQARQALDYNVNNRINAEEYNRQNADAALSQTMNQGFQTLGSQMTALNAAISALNAAYQNGYLYGGIATPSSSPSNNKCFYIALQGGTYTNFGGVGVVEGINIIKNDSGWKVEHIYDQTTLLNEFYLLRQQVIQAITSFDPIVIEGDVTNAPDEEDLTSNANHLLQFKNNAYSPLEFSGLGRKYLRKNIAPLSESAPFYGFVEGVTAEETLSGTPTQIFWDRMNTRFVGIKDGVYYLDWTDSDNYVPVSTSLVYMYNGTPYQWTGSDFIVDETEVPNLVNCLTQDMINEANTIYIIRYDYTLKEDITIPANCVLQFDGGSISGEYTITGNNTGIQAGLVKILNTDVTLAGTFVTDAIYPELFGAKGDGVADDADAIQAAELFAHCTPEKRISSYNIAYTNNKITFLNRNYGIGKTIYIGSDISIDGNGCSIRPLNNGVFDLFSDADDVSRKYMFASKDINQVGDPQKVLWNNISLYAYDYTDGAISGIFFAAQGYIKRIQSYNIDCVVCIPASYKDFVELDGFYMMDGNPDVWKIHGGYLGDARNFKNIWCSTEKSIKVGKGHWSCSVDHMISGSLEINTSDTSVSNCMFNSSEGSKVYIAGGAKVVFTNCYFGITGDSKITITDGPYNWRKSKVTFISCTFNYNAPYLSESFEDNIINCPESNSNITFIDTFFNDQNKISQVDMYKHAPHIKGLDGLNMFIGIGLNNTNRTLPCVQLYCGSTVRTIAIGESSQAANLLGTTETWNYEIIVLYDVKRQLVGNAITASIDVNPVEGGFIRLGFTNTNWPPALYIKKTRGNVTEYAIVPMCTFDSSFYDTGITVAGRKWKTGDILNLDYYSSPLNIIYKGITPDDMEPANVEIVTDLTSAQFNNRIKNNNTTNWKAGDIVELNDYTRLIKKRDGNWYVINETLLS